MFIPILDYFRIHSNLKRNVWLKTSELEVLQWKKVRSLIDHAYKNVRFYHDLFDREGVKPENIKTTEDLAKLPIITKEQVKTAGDKILSNGVDKRKCVTRYTSGSTGIPLKLLFRKDDAHYASASYERCRTENGFKPFRDSLLIVGCPPETGGRFSNVLRALQRRRYINVQDNLDDQIPVLLKTKPDAIWGYPSGIKILAHAVGQRRIGEVNPRLVFTASETLDQSTRNLINSVMNVDVLDVYGAWEAGCMAWECSKHSGYHMSMDTVVLESVRDGERVSAGERGKVVITNLHSHAMPLIRYRLGDIAIPTDEECSCGRGGYLLKRIQGRSDDYIRFSDGRILSPLVFPYMMKSWGDEILSYRLIQEKEDEFTMKLVGMNEISDETIKKIFSELRGALGDNVQIRFRVVKEIERDNSGKLRSVVSRVSKKESF